MFYFVVRNFRWLAHVPTFPQIFDSILLAGTWLFRPSQFAAMENLETEAVSMLGVQIRTHRFGGTEFQVNGRELGHIHGHGLLDVFLTRESAERLILADRVRRHHVFPQSRWVSFQLKSYHDVPFALELLTMARRSENQILDDTHSQV